MSLENQKIGLTEKSESIGEIVDRFDAVESTGIPVAHLAPFGVKIYDIGKREEVSTRNFMPIYSLEFLETHDVLAKYIDQTSEDELSDENVGKVLDIVRHSTREELESYLHELGYQPNISDEVYERIQAIEEMNGEAHDILDNIDVLSGELMALFSDVQDLPKYSKELTQKDYIKAAFAISKISERASYSNEFNFIDNAIKYIQVFLGVNFQSLEHNTKQELIEIINKGAKNPVFNLLNNYAHPIFEDYQLDTIKGIYKPDKWFALYREAIIFLIKVFSKNNESLEETYNRIIQKYGISNGLLPKSYSYFTDSITIEDMHGVPDFKVKFDKFSEFMKGLIIKNAACENEEAWNTFSLATFILEVIGKINQVNSYKRATLEEANQGLIDKFIRSSNSSYEYVLDQESSNSRNTVLLSKICIEGEVIPVMYKFAKIKTKESMLRKTLVKGTPVTGMKDKFRMMVVLPPGSLMEENKRRKICAALINTHATFLGNEFVEDSIKNTFENGSSSQFSLGALRCFKYVTKFELERFTDTVEVMILEKYPDDHDDYERNMYKKLREAFALCNYAQAMEELAEEISRKAHLGFTVNDKHIIRPLLGYVLNMSPEAINETSKGFRNNVNNAFAIAMQCEELGIETTRASTCLGILNMMVHSDDLSEPEEEDMENLSQ